MRYLMVVAFMVQFTILALGRSSVPFCRRTGTHRVVQLVYPVFYHGETARKRIKTLSKSLDKKESRPDSSARPSRRAYYANHPARSAC
jgi:hypothetical protein